MDGAMRGIGEAHGRSMECEVLGRSRRTADEATITASDPPSTAPALTEIKRFSDVRPTVTGRRSSSAPPSQLSAFPADATQRAGVRVCMPGRRWKGCRAQTSGHGPVGCTSPRFILCIDSSAPRAFKVARLAGSMRCRRSCAVSTAALRRLSPVTSWRRARPELAPHCLKRSTRDDARALGPHAREGDRMHLSRSAQGRLRRDSRHSRALAKRVAGLAVRAAPRGTGRSALGCQGLV